MPLPTLIASALMPTKINLALVVLTRLEYQLPTLNYFSTFGTPIIFRRFHGRPQERVVGHGLSLSVH